MDIIDAVFLGVALGLHAVFQKFWGEISIKNVFLLFAVAGIVKAVARRFFGGKQDAQIEDVQTKSGQDSIAQKAKDFLWPILVMILVIVFVSQLAQLFLGSKQDVQTEDIQTKSEQRFVAPKQEMRPLNVEIDFIDTRRPAPAVETSVETEWGWLTFSSDGASLERLEFKRETKGAGAFLGTIFPVSDAEKEKRCFLVGLDQKTPYYYKLADTKELDRSIVLQYHVETPELTMYKTFTIFKDKHQIDLEMKVIPKKGDLIGVEPRIFYPAPIMPALESEDIISAVTSDEKGSIKKIVSNKLDLQQGWLAPTLFGGDNRYFVHALINDQHGFAQRAYYKIAGHNELFAVIEGPRVEQQHTWELSFYFGPKEAGAFDAVDSRLNQLLDYNKFFAPIAKFLLMLLSFLYSYLHNYGLAIIVLTFLIKIVLLPFTVRGEGDLKKRQVEFDKKLRYIQQRYKDDAEALARARADLVQKHGMPGLGGCLPLLLQAPIFYTLSRVLAGSIQLYKAPFGFWITDLSARDPYYILPMLIAGSMLMQSVSAEPKQRMTLATMALVFGAFAVNFSAGLALYFFINTLLTVMQTMLQKRFKQA